ncbi:hypothetical protein [Mucilaginibacter flavus]|uniref:hypothetical protein n=1 Tax=Mucilaginibacter flavus TaxID=931504 RepID=UPI0025B2C6DE|nr:hypothetical protein [Mucilaginibacter flavus]MDN3581891.1 hypothetical protein [Mucilaginibacter flavus]
MRSAILATLLSVTFNVAHAQFKVSDLYHFIGEFNRGSSYPSNAKLVTDVSNELLSKGFVLATFSWEQDVNGKGNFLNKLVFDDRDGNAIQENLSISTEEPAGAGGYYTLTLTLISDNFSQYGTWLTDAKAMIDYNIDQQNPLLTLFHKNDRQEEYYVSLELVSTRKTLSSPNVGEIFTVQSPKSYKITIQRTIKPLTPRKSGTKGF